VLTLSVLDQSPISSGATAYEAIDNTIRLAQATEKMGYYRYWLAEHHGTDGLAGCAPEILIPRVASATSRMRIGSGGVMLSHYSPLKVAENFSLLSTMYPGRIDLGLGRAPGGDRVTSLGMSYGSSVGVEYYPTKVVDLKAFLTGGRLANEALAHCRITPNAPEAPEIWLLGSSDSSARLAAMLGLPFSFAHFINPYGAQEILRIYSESFEPSESLTQPRANICVGAVCAQTEEEADHLAKSRMLWRLQLEKGQLGPYPSPEEAEAYPYTDQERHIAEKAQRGAVVGTPADVKSDIKNIAEECGVDEVMVVTICHDFESRVKSYRLVAEAFGLNGDVKEGRQPAL